MEDKMEQQAEQVKVRKPRKKRTEFPTKQDGKFLCVENLSGQTQSFRNPDPKNLGLNDLTVVGWDTEVIDDHWLDVAWFVRAINDGRIRAFRADAPPLKRDLSVPPNADLSGNKLLDAQALGLVANPEFDSLAQALVNVEPRSTNNMVDKDWLKETGIRFLRNVIAREKKWRNRSAVIEACQQRVLEINSL